MKKHTPVLVEWTDAASQDPWTTEDALERVNRNMPVQTVGLLLKRDDKGIRIATSRGLEGGSYAGVWDIPAGCITKVKRLKL